MRPSWPRPTRPRLRPSTVSPTSTLARYCRAQLKLQPGDDWQTRRYFGDRGYPRGWHFWQPGNFPGQSVDTHLKGATAFRAVLAKYGIRADVNSRLD